MDIHVRITWLGTAKLTVAPVMSSAFNVVGQRGLFGRFAVPEALSLDPRRFEPTVSFHEWATHRLFDSRTVRRGPYEEIELAESLRLVIEKVDASVFPGDIAVVRVAATATLHSSSHLDLDLATLQGLRSSKAIPTVRKLISFVLDRLVGDKSGTGSLNSYHDYFVMLVGLPPTAVDFMSALGEREADVVGLLIGTREPKTLNAEVIQRTISANAELNSKSRDELMLLNRKGALIVRPAGPYGGPHVDRLAKARDLATISQFTWVYLNCLQDNQIARDSTAWDALHRIRRWVEQPELTFFSSVSNTLTWISLSKAMLLAKNLAAASGADTVGSS